MSRIPRESRAKGQHLASNFAATIKAPGESGSRTDYSKGLVDAVVSTAAVDRDGEIILPSAFLPDLALYRSNPILCWGHPVGDGGSPGPDRLLGCAVDIQIINTGSVNDHVRVLFEYAHKANQMAKLCLDLTAGGYLRAYSIGALMKEWLWFDDPPAKLAALPAHAQAALKSGEADLVHTRMELIEISNVFVGSNRQALTRAIQDGVVSRELVARALGRGGDNYRERSLFPVGKPRIANRIKSLEQAFDLEGFANRFAAAGNAAMRAYESGVNSAAAALRSARLTAEQMAVPAGSNLHEELEAQMSVALKEARLAKEAAREEPHDPIPGRRKNLPHCGVSGKSFANLTRDMGKPTEPPAGK